MGRVGVAGMVLMWIRVGRCRVGAVAMVEVSSKARSVGVCDCVRGRRGGVDGDMGYA